MSIIPHVDKDISNLSKFVDFDCRKNIFYDNLYIKDRNLVIKLPLLFRTKLENEIRFERFDLTRYTYLFDYD